MGAKQFGYRFAQGFAYGDFEQSTAKKRIRRERFLAEMEAVVPWSALIDLIEPHYPRPRHHVGVPLEREFRTHSSGEARGPS
jgi:transposase, IS5 family